MPVNVASFGSKAERDTVLVVRMVYGFLGYSKVILEDCSLYFLFVPFVSRLDVEDNFSPDSLGRK